MTVAIPTSPAELEEMLNDSTKMKAVLAEPGAFKELIGNYAKTFAKTDSDVGAQVREQVQIQMAEFLEKNGMGKKSVPLNFNWDNTPRAAGSGAVRNAAYNPKSPCAQLDGLYGSLGELASDVQRHRSGHDVSNKEGFAKVQQISNAYASQDPAGGGFLIPEETRSQLLQLALEQSVVRSRATVITMGSLTTKIPFVDHTTNVGSVFGGMIFYWVGESETITATNAKFGNVKLEANKLVGGARVPNELWNDAPALTTWLEMAAPQGLSFYEDVAFIAGDGVDKPLGVLNSPAKIQVTRATSGTLKPSDIYSMYSRMLPQSLGNAVWLVNQTLLPALFGMQTIVQNVAGTENVGGGFPLGVVNIAGQPVPTILGRPMIVTEKMPALANGAGDDIALVDWRYYLLGDRQAVSLDYSEHSRFMNDETELRLIERVDGQPWVQSPLTPLNGSTLSPFISLSN